MTKNEKISCTVFAWKWQLILVTSLPKMTKNERWNEPGKSLNLPQMNKNYVILTYFHNFCWVHFIFRFSSFLATKLPKSAVIFRQRQYSWFFRFSSFWQKSKNERWNEPGITHHRQLVKLAMIPPHHYVKCPRHGKPQIYQNRFLLVRVGHSWSEFCRKREKKMYWFSVKIHNFF